MPVNTLVVILSIFRGELPNRNIKLWSTDELRHNYVIGDRHQRSERFRQIECPHHRPDPYIIINLVGDLVDDSNEI